MLHASPSSSTSGGAGARLQKLRARRAPPSSPTSGGAGARLQKLSDRRAPPSSPTSGGASARLQKLPARRASPSSSGSSDGAKAVGGFPGEGPSNARRVFIDLTCTTEEEQEGRKYKGKEVTSPCLHNPTSATCKKKKGKEVIHCGSENCMLLDMFNFNAVSSFCNAMFRKWHVQKMQCSILI